MGASMSETARGQRTVTQPGSCPRCKTGLPRSVGHCPYCGQANPTVLRFTPPLPVETPAPSPSEAAPLFMNAAYSTLAPLTDAFAANWAGAMKFVSSGLLQEWLQHSRDTETAVSFVKQTLGDATLKDDERLLRILARFSKSSAPIWWGTTLDATHLREMSAPGMNHANTVLSDIFSRKLLGTFGRISGKGDYERIEAEWSANFDDASRLWRAVCGTGISASRRPSEMWLLAASLHAVLSENFHRELDTRAKLCRSGDIQAQPGLGVLDGTRGASLVMWSLADAQLDLPKQGGAPKPQPAPEETSATSLAQSDERKNILIVYGLYLSAWLLFGIPAVVGVAMSYSKRDKVRGTVWESHGANQTTTFWIALAVFVISAMISASGLAAVIRLGGLGYCGYRCVRGLLKALENHPYE